MASATKNEQDIEDSAKKGPQDSKGSAQTTLEEDIRALRADIAALVENIGRMASDVKSGAQEGMQPGLNGAGHAGHDFAADAEKLKTDSVRAAGEAAGNAATLLAGEIRRNPFTAIATALCVGFVVGMTRHR